MAESTVTVKVELSDESKRLIAEMVKPMYVLTCDPPVPITPPGIRYVFLDEEPTPARNGYMEEALGRVREAYNHYKEILRIAERCKTVDEFDEATAVLEGRIEGVERSLWNNIIALTYEERYGE